MAGVYPDVPGIKFQYDLDGSAMGQIEADGTTISTYSTGTMQTINNESSDVLALGVLLQSPGKRPFVLFPEPRNLAGYYMALVMDSFTSAETLQTSVDTTNGLDGTWVTQAGPTWANWSAAWRSGITPLVVTGIKAIRWTMRQTTGSNQNGWIAAFHLYGTIPSTSSPDRLRIWHPTLDQEMGAAGFDYGDFGRTGTIDRTFRVKNNSSSLTANSIVLSTGALTDTSPTVLSQMTVSQGGAFASTQNIGALAPGAISAVCTLRIASLSNTTLGLWRQRLVATAGSWT